MSREVYAGADISGGFQDHYYFMPLLNNDTAVVMFYLFIYFKFLCVDATPTQLYSVKFI